MQFLMPRLEALGWRGSLNIVVPGCSEPIAGFVTEEDIQGQRSAALLTDYGAKIQIRNMVAPSDAEAAVDTGPADDTLPPSAAEPRLELEVGAADGPMLAETIAEAEMAATLAESAAAAAAGN